MTDEELGVSTQQDNLAISTTDIANQIIEEMDADRLKELTKLFNLNIAKKNILRVLKLDGLRDKVTDNIIERFDKVPGEFTNEELLKYIVAIDNSIEKAQKTAELTENPPQIQINQQNNINVTVGDEELNREERMRVMDAIAMLLSAEQPQTDFRLNDEEK